MEEKELAHEQQVENDMLVAANEVEKKSIEDDILKTAKEANKVGEKIDAIEGEKVEEKSDAQEMAEFLAKDENKKNAVSLAAQIEEYMGNKWFTVEKFQSKTGLKKMDAMQKLQMVKLFGHAQLRIGNGNDGPEKAGKPLFKIAITREMQIRAINEIIEYHRQQIQDFELKKKALGEN